MSTVVIGGGPAALGLLVAGLVSGELDALLSDGLTVLDAGPAGRFGAGRLGRYQVRSDTRARVFAESVGPVLSAGRPAGPVLGTGRPGRSARPSGPGGPSGLLERCRSDEPVPLTVAAALLAEAGRVVLERVRAGSVRTGISGGIGGAGVRCAGIEDAGAGRAGAERTGIEGAGGGCTGTERAGAGGAVHSRTRVSGVAVEPDGVWLRGPGWRPVRADRVVLATGGRPWIPPDLPAGGRLVLHSDQVLRDGGYRRLLGQLSGQAPRVTVIGGSHSAFAVVGRLLRAPVRWGTGAITVAHRSPILVTYPDVAAARADGVIPRPEQVCPLTGVVHRFGGLRSDAATTYRRVRQGSEPRVRLLRVPSGWDWLGGEAGDAAVVAATGYTSAGGELLGLPGGRWDGLGRFRDPAGAIVPHVFGLGLGTARPRGPGTGGEPAFGGAIDGVWFYQHVVAPQLLPLLLEDLRAG